MFETLARKWRWRRFELLEHLECLKSRRLRLAEITVAGVAHGSPPTPLALERVISARCAPIVASEQWSSADGHVHDHRAGQALPLPAAVQSAIASDGLLILKDHVGLLLRAGVVLSIEIYRPALAHFCYIRSFVDLLDQFGLPDTVTTRRRNGEAAQHTLSYHGNHKQLLWDCASNALCSVRLGNHGEQSRPTPPRGGKRKLPKPRLPFALPRPTLTPGEWAPHPA